MFDPKMAMPGLEAALREVAKHVPPMDLSKVWANMPTPPGAAAGLAAAQVAMKELAKSLPQFHGEPMAKMMSEVMKYQQLDIKLPSWKPKF